MPEWILDLVLVVATLGLCALSGLLLALYFRALQPRAGTLEWIRRFDRRSFAWPQAGAIQWADGLWLVLTALCAAGGGFLVGFFQRGLHRLGNALALLQTQALTLLELALPGALLAAGMYVLVKSLFGSAPAGFSAGLLAALVHREDVLAAAGLVWALAFFWRYVCLPPQAPFLRRGGLLLPAAGCFTAGCVQAPGLMLLAPFLVAGFVTCLCFRARRGSGWVADALGALVLALPCLLVTAAFGYGAVRNLTLSAALADLRLYEQLVWSLAQALSLSWLPGLPTAGAATDMLAILAGFAGLAATLHGAVKLRRTVCLVLPGLLVALVAPWLLGGFYALDLALVVMLGQLWQVLDLRNRRAGVLMTLAGLLCCFAALLPLQ